ncbi:MAG: DEAD/DEAH box helicase [Vulcanimicrobiota bacterium]
MSDSFRSFDLLKSSLTALERMGIDTPTPIQAQALPLLLDGHDLIGQARTGSGKTLAFSLPMMEYVEPSEKEVQALVLTPTRELATQIATVVEELAKADRLRTLTIFGGRAIGPQEKRLRDGIQIVVGTPGRVLDLIQRGTLKLHRVNYVVIDEADEMLDQGFAPAVERILGSIKHDHLTALFSATMPDWVHQASRKYLHKPRTVAIDTAPEDVPDIEHLACEVPEGLRFKALTCLLEERGDGSAIIFGRTKYGVKKLTRILEREGYPVAALQGNMSQNARDRVMQAFRDGEVGILVATNVAARGLDVDHVELVINYELPENHELLTHRVGRTGRMGRQGRAFTLLTPSDATKWRSMERGLGRSIKKVRWQDPDSRPSRQSRSRRR